MEGADSTQCFQILSAAADGTCLVWDLRMEPKDLERDISSQRESMQLGQAPTSSQALKQLDLLWRPLLRIYVSSDVTPEYLITRACVAPQSSSTRAALAGGLGEEGKGGGKAEWGCRAYSSPLDPLPQPCRTRARCRSRRRP